MRFVKTRHGPSSSSRHFDVRASADAILRRVLGRSVREMERAVRAALS